MRLKNNGQSFVVVFDKHKHVPKYRLHKIMHLFKRIQQQVAEGQRERRQLRQQRLLTSAPEDGPWFWTALGTCRFCIAKRSMWAINRHRHPRQRMNRPKFVEAPPMKIRNLLLYIFRSLRKICCKSITCSSGGKVEASAFEAKAPFTAIDTAFIDAPWPIIQPGLTGGTPPPASWALDTPIAVTNRTKQIANFIFTKMYFISLSNGSNVIFANCR